MLIRADALLAAGLLDERSFIYSEEPDLCLRIKRGGWKVTHLPQMKIIHHVGKGGVRPRMVAQDAYSRKLYAEKHFGPLHRSAYLSAVGLRHLVRAGASIFDREHGADRREAGRRALRTLLGREDPPFGQPPATAITPGPREPAEPAAGPDAKEGAYPGAPTPAGGSAPAPVARPERKPDRPPGVGAQPVGAHFGLPEAPAPAPRGGGSPVHDRVRGAGDIRRAVAGHVVVQAAAALTGESRAGASIDEVRTRATGAGLAFPFDAAFDEPRHDVRAGNLDEQVVLDVVIVSRGAAARFAGAGLFAQHRSREAGFWDRDHLCVVGEGEAFLGAEAGTLPVGVTFEEVVLEHGVFEGRRAGTGFRGVLQQDGVAVGTRVAHHVVGERDVFGAVEDLQDVLVDALFVIR